MITILCAGSRGDYQPYIALAQELKKLGIPSVLASPFPMHKTKEYLSVVLYGKSKPNPLTLKLSYAMIQGMLWLASSSSVKSYWKSVFGKLPESFGSPYERHVSSKCPAIISCSNHIFKRPADWNAHIHQSGYWFVEESADYTPPKDLQDFLNAGDKPVYIGFGSMSMTEQLDELGEMAVTALKKIGKRGIISGMGRPKNMTEDIFIVDSVPHTWLFEQVSAVCHHGGAGTSASGFRAGVPSIIIPFSNDQFAWAHRAYDLGIGAKPIPKKQLTANALASAIQYAEQAHIVQKAKFIGTQIKQERGAYDCAKVILNRNFNVNCGALL